MPGRLVHLLLVAVGLGAAAHTYVAHGLRTRGGAPGDGLFPFVAAVGLVVCVGLAVALDVVRRRVPERLAWGGRALATLTVLLLFYGFALPRFGYSLTTAALLVAVAKLASPRLSWARATVVAVALAVGTFFVFAWGLGVPLPVGPVGLL